MKQYRKLVLASGSPRRRELLSAAGLTFEVVQSTEDEKITETLPDRIVMDLAARKAGSVASALSKPGTLVIGADTIVVLESSRGDEIPLLDARPASGFSRKTSIRGPAHNKILGKPRDKEEALSMLLSLSGRVHQVFTGVCVLEPPGKEPPALLFFEETQVEMEPYDRETALSFIETGIPMDKAGAYAIQGLGSFLVKGITGDFHNVMGFPLGRFIREGMKKGWFKL
ncbi:MAG: Maf-like protein [Lachnospiraceae bacterium]|nr:Maf-like protein [Lachnospiraceae bacterium]